MPLTLSLSLCVYALTLTHKVPQHRMLFTVPHGWPPSPTHMSQARLEQLMSVVYIPKLQEKMDSCEYCWYGKQNGSLHSLPYETVRQPLELVHTDICGPMLERSLGGSQYFITFVDDSRKVWAPGIHSVVSWSGEPMMTPSENTLV